MGMTALLLHKGNAKAIPPTIFPYDPALYGNDLRCAVEVWDEVTDLIRRYIMVSPGSVALHEERYYCLVEDEASGITRELLGRLGYELMESAFPNLYWILLKTTIERRKKK